MRILHFIHRYYPAEGGAERHLAAVSEELVAAGHDVTVVTSDALDFERVWRRSGRRQTARSMRHNGVDILYFPLRHLPMASVTYPAVRLATGTWARLFGSSKLTSRLSRLTPWLPALDEWLSDPAQHGRYDLVAAMGITFEGIIDRAANFARREQIPFLLYPLAHLGSGPAPGQDHVSRFYTLPQQNKLAAEAQALLVSNSGEIAYYLSCGISKDRLFLSGPGVDPAEIAGGNGPQWRQHHNIDRPLVLTLGNQTAEKGVPDVIKASQLLWKAGEKFYLVLAGNISVEVSKICERLSSHEKKWVRQLGPVDEQTKKDVLAAADIFCLPSRADSFGIVYLEAWFYQKPVVAAATWGIQNEVVEDHVNGLIVPFGQPPAVAKSLRRLLDEPNLRQRLGAAGHQKLMSHHTWAVKLPQIIEVYRQFAPKPIEGTAP